MLIIQARATAGSTFEETITQAKKLAAHNDCNVEVNFNGVSVIATPKDMVNDDPNMCAHGWRLHDVSLLKVYVGKFIVAVSSKQLSKTICV